MESSLLSVPFEGAESYSEAYKIYVFRFWYNNDKRGAKWTWKNIPMSSDHVTGKKLTESALNNWINDDFQEYALSLDTQVGRMLDETIIKERIEMMNRHAAISLEMQELAMEYLRDKPYIDTRTAIQLLVKGIEIERESRGLPISELLEFKDKTDRELVDTLRNIVTDGKILDIEPYEPDTSKKS